MEKPSLKEKEKRQNEIGNSLRIEMALLKRESDRYIISISSLFTKEKSDCYGKLGYFFGIFEIGIFSSFYIGKIFSTSLQG